MKWPARYTNRAATGASENAGLPAFALDGYYYLSVSLGSRGEDGLAAAPITLAVAVDGAPEPGPVYAEQPAPPPMIDSTGAAPAAAGGDATTGTVSRSSPLLWAGASSGILILAIGSVLGWRWSRRRPRR